MLFVTGKMPVQIEHRQFDIFQRRGAREQIEALKNEADL